MFCSNCGKAVAEQAIMCPGCGVRPFASTAFCWNCGGSANPGAEVCLKCGVGLKKTAVAAAGEVSPKSRAVTSVLAWFVGFLGVHRFYLGKMGTGILMLVTLGGVGVWALIDFIMAVSGRMKDKDGLPISEW